MPVPRPGWQPPEALDARERRFTLLFSGAWLIFLGWPILEVLASPGNGPASRTAGIALIAVFAVAYLVSITWPRPLKSIPLVANTVVQTTILAALIAAAAPFAGPTVAGMAPYIMALWMFNHRVVVGLPAAFLVGAIAALAVAVIADREFTAGYLTPIIFTAGILTMFRLAIEHSEVTRELSERVALAEQREELARTVHDALGHSLTSITVQAQLARRLVAADPDAAERQLDGILATARDSLRDVRSTVEFLDAPGLDEQLDHARTTLTAAGIEPGIPHTADLPDLDPADRRLFSWCLREAITNVVRHSGATRCSVEIISATGEGENRSGAVLRVIDDGAGIVGGKGGDVVAHGTGLRGLSRRAERANATLELSDATPGDTDRPGTILEVRT
ncbi:hypothetical protein HMPREF1650_09940 [Corynebacterium freneyi DNF00450]|uniref:Signal transduction histidine kinase subgroup 3 dimerisation and phosphoacceptor domain-containing protein n=1 Tax=Corynebacterium freneyi DNF00450 TaxID=1287475 RepID=A0A095ZAX1_9CORY|nr:hypothetical protein HMPREF1650_09940 [Corynebacterium freneyi DNF00450]